MKMEQSDLAAWVQAVGSVAAIIAAVLLSWWQQRENSRLQRRQFERARYEKVSGIGGLLQGVYTELWEANNAAGGAGWYDYIIRRFDRAKFFRAVDALERAPLHELGNWRIVTACNSAKEAGQSALKLLERLQDKNTRNPSRQTEEECDEIDRLFNVVNHAMAPIVRALAYDHYESGPISEWKEHLDLPEEMIPSHLRPPSIKKETQRLRLQAVRLGIKQPNTVIERFYAIWHWRNIRKKRLERPWT
jgi:hypothetical protein